MKRERIKVTGEKLLATVKKLVHEGNIRRIALKNDQDRTIFEIPLTIGVVGAVLLPLWVALGAVAALAADFTLEVERVETDLAGEIGDGEAEVEEQVTA